MPSFLIMAALGAASLLPHPGNATLEAGAAAFAGTAVAVDARLARRECPGGFRFGWSDPSARAVEALCAARGERLVLPLAAPPLTDQAGDATRLRRGDPVTATVQGHGFRVTAGALAANTQRDGALQARNSRTGSIVHGRLAADGRLHVAAGNEPR